MPDTVYGHGEGWSFADILEPIAPPPPRLIESPGGRLVSVKTPLGASPARSYPAVILAWAPIDRRAGTWAALMVWDGYRHAADGKDRAHARWSWVRWNRDQVVYAKPYLPDQPTGLRWFGRHHGMDVEAAYEEAAASLPEQMREAALAYTPYDGPPANS